MLKGKILEESSRTVWAEFKPGFQVEIKYSPRGKLGKIYEQATVKEWDPKGFMKSTVDSKKLYELMAKDLMVGWRGLTPGILRTMVDMESYPDSEVPYSAEDAAELLEKAYDFDGWVQKITTDLEIFEAARRAAETKNS